MARLDAFFSEFFASPEQGVKAAFTPFETTEEFEKLFEAHLSAWIATHRRSGPPRRWRVEERGSPFVGLEPFDRAHAAVYFGRGADVERARERLEAAMAGGCAFLLVDGASGAGKSSLMRAGLVPRLLSRAPDLRVAYARPGDSGGAIGALASGLFEPGALPELALGDFPTPRELAAHFSAGRGIAPVVRALDRAADLILPLSDNAALLLGSAGGWIRHGRYDRAYLWRPDEGILHRLVVDTPLGGASASPDGKLIALHEGLGSLDHHNRRVTEGVPQVSLWDAETGALVGMVALPEPAMASAWSVDPDRLVVRTPELLKGIDPSALVTAELGPAVDVRTLDPSAPCRAISALLTLTIQTFAAARRSLTRSQVAR